MKKITIITVILLNSLISVAQAPNWLWAKGIGGYYDDVGCGIAADANNNILVAGYFEGSSITFGTFTLTNPGSRNIFLVKYDPYGTVLWARCASGSGWCGATGVAIDDYNNIIITGYFQSPTISFGGFTLTNTDTAYYNSEDIFIAKYDASGNVLWAKGAGGMGNDESMSIAADAGNNILITGYFSGPSVIFSTDTLANAGYINIFIAKYDASGNFMWGKRAGGDADDKSNGVSSDANNNIFITGYFTSSSVSFGTDTLTNSGGQDVFITKYDASGNVQWARKPGGIGWTYNTGQAITVDASNNIIATGSFETDTIIFGTFKLDNVGGPDIYIAKYDGSGNVVWAVSAASNCNDWSRSITTDAGNNILVTGFFDDQIAFGNDTLDIVCGEDIFVAKYNSAGNELWAKSTGDAADDESLGIAVDANYNVIITGGFYSWGIPFGNDTLSSYDDQDIFIAKLNSVITVDELISGPTDLTVYPNPTNGKIFIENPSVNGKEFLSVYNMHGQLLCQQFFGQPVSEIDLSALVPGVYFLKLSTKDGSVIRKIIKE